jgi:2-methylcitrate dehydratase PrpD
VDYPVLPDGVQQRAKHCLLDWLGLALFGSNSAAATMMRKVVVGERGRDGEATLLGTGFGRASVVDAALINGVASHAFDFDNGCRLGTGHPTCTAIPAALAVAEANDASGRDLLAATVAGYETASRIAALVTPVHYDLGFHSTATLGCFSAAAASAHLLRLDAHRWRVALGLAGTQAAGLRIHFGTMTKSFHAGRAASSGVLASILAREGFTAADDVLEGRKGFVWTHTTQGSPEAALRPLGSPYVLEHVDFKYHTACFGTHSAIDGARQLVAENAIDPAEIDHITVRVTEHLLDVCNIRHPSTGIEGKFSLTFTTAVALLGLDTAKESTFSDENATDAAIVALMDRTTVEASDLNVRNGPTEVSLALKDGRTLSISLDTRQQPESLDAEWDRLLRKFTSVTADTIGERAATRFAQRVQDFDREPSVRGFVSDLIGEARGRD